MTTEDSPDPIKATGLRYTGEQRAIAHLIVPFCDAKNVIDDLLDKIVTVEPGLTQEQQDQRVAEIESNGDFPSIANPRITQLAGQVDAAVSLAPRSLRRIFRYNQSLGGRHLSCQWVLGKVLAFPADWGAPVFEELEPENPAVPCFFVHIRIHRHLYAKHGLEADQVALRHIVECLKAPGAEMRAQLITGIGWSDYVLYGYMPEEHLGYCDFVGEIQRAEIEGELLFQNTVSLLGYERRRPASKDDFEARARAAVSPYSLSFRIEAGRVPEAYPKIWTFLKKIAVLPKSARVQDFFGIYLTTGKTDLLGVPLLYGPNVAEEFGNIHLDPKYRDDIKALKKSGVSSIETHIHALDPNQLIRQLITTEQEEQPEEEQQQLPCHCQSLIVRLNRLERHIADGDSDHPLLPSGLRESISAIYALFGSLLRDPHQCCDLAGVILACHEALGETLDDYWGHRKKQKTGAGHFNWLQRLLDDMKIWCSRTEKILEERSESFHEMFSRSSRLTSYRGNVQKYLITADYLVWEYMRDLSKCLELEGRITPSIFHFGATDVIESQLRGGLVTTIPSKYLFSLPLAMPQLWQEASVRAFNHLYKSPYSEESGAEVEDGFDPAVASSSFLIEELKFLDDMRKKAQERDGEKAAQKINLRIPSRQLLLKTLADHFGDLCVRFIVFDSFGEFELYLVTLALRSPANRLGGDLTRAALWEDILQRLLYVKECEGLLIKAGKLPRNQSSHDDLNVLPNPSELKVGDLDKEVTGQLQEFFVERLSQLRRNVHRIMKQDAEGRRNVGIEEDPSFEIDNDILFSVIHRRLRKGYWACHWLFACHFVYMYQGVDWTADSTVVDRLQDGYVVDLSNFESLNAFLREGYLHELKNHRLQGSVAIPQGMSALLRSVYLSAYKKYSHQRIEPDSPKAS